MGAAEAVEKNALVFLALFSALRERRCTPREVSMVDDVDDGEDGGSRASWPAPYKVPFYSPTPASSDRMSERPRRFNTLRFAAEAPLQFALAPSLFLSCLRPSYTSPPYLQSLSSSLNIRP